MLSRASRARSEAAFHDLVSFLDHLDLLDLAMTLPEWSAYFEIKVEVMDDYTAEQIKRGSIRRGESGYEHTATDDL